MKLNKHKALSLFLAFSMALTPISGMSATVRAENIVTDEQEEAEEFFDEEPEPEPEPEPEESSEDEPEMEPVEEDEEEAEEEPEEEPEDEPEMDPVSYLYPVYVDDDATKGIASWETGTITNYEVISADNMPTVLTGDKWYVVEGDVAYTGTDMIELDDDVSIILTDGCNMTMNTDTAGGPCIELTVYNLSVYGQSTDEETMGKLTAVNEGGHPAIGTEFYNSPIVSLNVYGGNITAVGSTGIGSRESHQTISIDGGIVSATALADDMAAIGQAKEMAGTYGHSNFIIIRGGSVHASASGSGAGIGLGNYGKITIMGGDVDISVSEDAVGLAGATESVAGMYGSVGLPTIMYGGSLRITSENSGKLLTGELKLANKIRVKAGEDEESAADMSIHCSTLEDDINQGKYVSLTASSEEESEDFGAYAIKSLSNFRVKITELYNPEMTDEEAMAIASKFMKGYAGDKGLLLVYGFDFYQSMFRCIGCTPDAEPAAVKIPSVQLGMISFMNDVFYLGRGTASADTTQYNITSDGSVTASCDTAAEGDIVFMKVNMPDNCIVDKFYVNGEEQTSSYFTMPAGDVTISAEYSRYLLLELPARALDTWELEFPGMSTSNINRILSKWEEDMPGCYSIVTDKIVNEYNGSITFEYASCNNKTCYNGRAQVLGNPLDNEDYDPTDRYFVITKKDFHSIFTDDTVTTDVLYAEPGDTVTMTAVVPDGMLFEYFEVNGAAQTGNTFTMPSENVNVTAVFTDQPGYAVTCDETVTADLAEAQAGKTVTLTANVPEGYAFDHFEVDGTTLTGDTFTMPDHAVSVHAVFTELPKYTVTCGENVSAEPEKALAGTTITLKANVPSGYVFDHFEVDGDTLTGSTFTMPEKNVTVSAVLNKLYTVTCGENVSADNTQVLAGTTITLKANVPSGSVFDHFEVDGDTLTGSTFTMPEKDVTVSAVFKKQYTITGDKTVSADKTVACAGEKVTMTAHPGRYYIVDKYYVNGVAQEGNTFVMPEGNVTLKATFLYTVPKPVKDIRTFYYTGKTYQFYPLYYYAEEDVYFSANGLYYDVSNDTRTEPGTQTVTVKLKDGYAWSDGSTKDLTFDFTVKKGLQQNVFVYYLKDLATNKIVAGFDDGSYVYDRDFPYLKYVNIHYAPNIYNVRDNAEVTYEYSDCQSRNFYDWDDSKNTFCYQGRGSIDDEYYDTYHISKWLPDEASEVVEKKLEGVVGDNLRTKFRNIFTEQIWKNFQWYYERDNGMRYLKIHIAPTDHYEGCTITSSGSFGQYMIYKSSAQVDCYELDAYMDVNNGKHWNYCDEDHPLASTIMNYLGSDAPVRERVNLLTVLSTSFEARDAYYSFIAGGSSKYAEKICTRNFYSFKDAVNYAKEEQDCGAAAEDITLTDGKKFRLSRKGYTQLSSVAATAYMEDATLEVTEMTEGTSEEDADLESLDRAQMTSITDIMSDEIVGDELLDGEVSPEEVEETVEVEGLDQVESDTEDIELEESYVIKGDHLLNLDLGDCDIDITGMGDTPVYEVEEGGILIIRSTNGGKIVSSNELSKFVKVDEGGILIVWGSDIIPESAIENYGYRFYPIVTDAAYTEEEDVESGTVDIQLRRVGDKLAKPEDPEREGYVFGGWYKDEALTEKWDFDNDTLTEADLADGMFTLYACWILKCTGDHEYDEPVRIEPTCTEDGSLTYTCIHGDYSYTEPISATGHSFTKYISNNDATCTDDGTKTAICDNGCGETDTIVDEGTALGHDYQSAVTQKPTTKEDGVRTFTCTRCGDTYTEAIPALKITQQPENYSGSFHSWGQFHVTVNGEGLTYHWYYSRNGRTWINLNFGTEEGDTYRVPITFTTNMIAVRCVIQDAYGNVVVSQPAVLGTDIRKTAEKLKEIFSAWGISAGATN